MLRKLLLVIVASCCFLGCEDAAFVDPATSSHVEHYHVGKKLLAFSVPGCVACERDKPQLAEIRRQSVPKGMGVVEIDATEYPEINDHYGVTQYPTYVLVEDGQIVERDGIRGFSDTLRVILKLCKIAFMIAIWLI